MNPKYLNKAFEENNLDVIISFSYQTRLWLTKVSATDGLLFIQKSDSYLFVDGRYIEAAQKNAKNCQVLLITKQNLEDFLAQKKYHRIGVEAEYLTVEQLNKIKQWFPSSEIINLSAQLFRIIKTEEEIQNIQKAVNISLEAYSKILPKIQLGLTEKSVDIELNYQMKLLGAEKESFDSIIATGPNSAMPHWRASSAKILDNDLLKIDFGALYNGYCADITRTSYLGKLDSKKEEILEIVKKAAELGRKKVAPGVKASEIDKACRDYIDQKGYGQYFVHSTGHGVGIDIHELPVVSANSDTILEPGMVITVEPGIYIPGVGGARIEDVVLVTQNGFKTLSREEES
ncbi:aminopeptidase P family protein [Mesomycoplasma ovipneumoniae]|uniref:Aminopeptidase P family protein n=1 Tax=Mesomycoplasma ovipneumoniae TaxID=29562 RepID=A0AAP5Y2R5_9BACT|nr:aminopeptidase P family protein [Mesomycoplasma ovipneumoniae]MDW2907197.1 aminopeptidase P family protein [Mesomycoplasma ovipneumoniae]MDW2909796.1 aminopeptidase P family protein [Mesomycoplasma ovipneumoniae]MDW2912435.1 aminopeptidase P family protein [Mesomycoplasma ovipneumoniae]MDW2912957.1 aminopeptidase P family protein [Mesomycoplasma ovipneumoniae]MDW2916269.1 aminopeptidase P family protein [Mesomycoplasma ovipneumoniae]